MTRNFSPDGRAQSTRFQMLDGPSLVLEVALGARDKRTTPLGAAVSFYERTGGTCTRRRFLNFAPLPRRIDFNGLCTRDTYSLCTSKLLVPRAICAFAVCTVCVHVLGHDVHECGVCSSTSIVFKRPADSD